MDKNRHYQDIIALLNYHNQNHLLKFYDQLDEGRKKGLLEQIEGLDFSKIPQWIEKYVKSEQPVDVSFRFEPAPSYGAVAKDSEQKQKYERARKLGSELLCDGKVAAFVVAGGQGTRLGFDGPKGDYSISPIKKKTLFEIFAETIIAAGDKYNTKLPLYVMTSPLNHSQTVELFESNHYYGLEKSDVFIFQQGTLPNFASDGRILLADKGTIAASPDGHGGSLKALYDSGAISHMKKRGVEYISYWQVDNPLVNIFDPLFIGLHVLDGSQMSSKALIKSHPTEKVGNFCLVDGKVTVIEYSDLPDEQAYMRNEDGSLVFELGSIGIHIISVDFVEHLNKDGFALPIHRAVKKIPYIDAQGRKINPTEPNGVKLETFVFDALPLAAKSIILQTIRSEEFAPVKNAVGDDSPEVTRRMMIERAADWLESAGVAVPRKKEGSIDCVIEIAPTFATCKEDVAAKVDRLPKIAPGAEVYLSS